MEEEEDTEWGPWLSWEEEEENGGKKDGGGGSSSPPAMTVAAGGIGAVGCGGVLHCWWV